MNRTPAPQHPAALMNRRLFLGVGVAAASSCGWPRTLTTVPSFPVAVVGGRGASERLMSLLEAAGGNPTWIGDQRLLDVPHRLYAECRNSNAEMLAITEGNAAEVDGLRWIATVASAGVQRLLVDGVSLGRADNRRLLARLQQHAIHYAFGRLAAYDRAFLKAVELGPQLGHLSAVQFEADCQPQLLAQTVLDLLSTASVLFGLAGMRSARIYDGTHVVQRADECRHAAAGRPGTAAHLGLTSASGVKTFLSVTCRGGETGTRRMLLLGTRGAVRASANESSVWWLRQSPWAAHCRSDWHAVNFEGRQSTSGIALAASELMKLPGGEQPVRNGISQAHELLHAALYAGHAG